MLVSRGGDGARARLWEGGWGQHLLEFKKAQRDAANKEKLEVIISAALEGPTVRRAGEESRPLDRWNVARGEGGGKEGEGERGF